MKTNEITIRNGTPSDGESVRSIAFAVMKSFELEPNPDGIDFELGHFGENHSGILAQLVACKKEVVIGSVILVKKSTMVGKLTGFYVDPKSRGLGAGKKLLVEVINRAKNTGLSGIYLETWDKMEQAVRLYKKFGWERASDPPIKSGAQRSYYLEIEKDNK